MSGFLHQLAARSLGLAPAARPRAALPYAAPVPETLAPALAAMAPDAPAALAAAPLPATRRDPSGPAPEPAAMPPTDRRTAAEPPPASHPRTASAGIPALPSVLPTVSAPRQRPDTSHEGDQPASPRPVIATILTGAAIPSVRPPENPAAAASRPADDEPTAGLLDLESLVSRLVGQATGHHPLTPDGTPSPSTAVAPATSQPPRPSYASHRPAERREAAEAANPATDTAPEVHITIGRLEVNAPSRPTPPPPRPRGPAPLALGDYLARRAGGRS